MLIREFIPNDLNKVHEIHCMSFDEIYDKLMFQKLYDIGSGFLVAEYEGEVIGYILFWIKDEGIGHIISIAVDREHRHSQAGSKLLSKALTLFKACNLEKVTLEVRQSNKIAIEFYKKFNFIVDRVVPNYYNDNESAVIMYFLF